jgi:hypothetical protein
MAMLGILLQPASKILPHHLITILTDIFGQQILLLVFFWHGGTGPGKCDELSA